MNKQEALDIAEKELDSYRSLPYEELVSKIGHAESFERVSESGEPYQIEFDCFFDDSEDRNIRVVGMVSYSWWTDFSPISSSFIMSPDRSFIGE